MKLTVVDCGHHHPLYDAVGVALPLEILTLEKAGGPNEHDYRLSREFAWVLGEQGAALQFREKETKFGPGTAKVFAGLVKALAVLSFAPGGVRFGPTRYEGEVSCEST